ncbi:MAG: SpoIID/LytB domain-containing protein [Myxococcota bacterium]
MRVLLFEDAQTIEVRGGGPDAQRVEPADGDGLSVAGRRRPAPARWRARGPDGILTVSRVDLPGSEDWQVRGELEVRRTPEGLAAINVLPLEDYLVATVGAEMAPGWEPEALRAQAVASRTYALHQRARRASEAYDLRADTGSQRYRGVSDEFPSVQEAVESTRSCRLVHEGRPIIAAFHSSSGGRTASAEEVWGRPVAYLVSLEVEGEEISPETYWRVALPGATLRRALEAAGWEIGRPERLEILARSESGRVTRLRVEGGRRTVELSGRELRQAVGETVLRSTHFSVRPDAEADGQGGFVFVGTGYGHGVGMSQWGARALAARGLGHEDILATFYPGTRLASCETPPAVAREGRSR